MIAALRRLPALETALLVVATLLLVAAGALRELARPSGAVLDSFSSYDAASGGYRAWYELLEREGLPVGHFERRPAFLDAAVATLVWAEPLTFDARQQRTTRADAAALEAWVRAGGRLLYIGHDDAAAQLGILHLPRSRATAARTGTFAIAPALRAAGVTQTYSAAALRYVQLPPGARPLIFDRAGTLAVDYPLGRGSVVALVDEALLTNAGIARRPNARLAYALARPAGRSGPIAFDEALHGFAVPEHWWALVPRPLAAALGLAAAAVCIGLGGTALRLGPPLPAGPARSDRSSADFVAALADLLERGRAGAIVLQDAANSAARALVRAPAAGDAAVEADLRALLAAARDPRPNDASLIRGVALAQRLRSEVTAYGRPRD